ncbi:MAG: cation:proton antiporter [Bryobacterales bacterium]|nr:cation:proton antiporter [Bryobacterales bacterium]
MGRRVAGIPGAPTGLCLLPPGFLAIRSSAGALAVADSVVGSEPSPADPARPLPGIGHARPSSPSQVVNFWRVGVGQFSRAPNDLGTVIALGLIFSPFTLRTLLFLVVAGVAFVILPFLTPWFFQRYGGRVSELETKYILFLLFGLGGLAVWAGSEAVLPAYVIGMVLAGTVGKDHMLIRRLRTLTFGLLTPFYFIRAGSFVSVPALAAAPLVFVALFLAKMSTKLAGVLPTVRAFGYDGHDGVYYSLMMSTGLTFGTISALFGLNNGIISQSQYSHLVATVIASAVVPTAIANARFLPRHLLPEQQREFNETVYGEPVGDLDS